LGDVSGQTPLSLRNPQTPDCNGPDVTPLTGLGLVGSCCCDLLRRIGGRCARLCEPTCVQPRFRLDRYPDGVQHWSAFNVDPGPGKSL